MLFFAIGNFIKMGEKGSGIENRNVWKDIQETVNNR